MPYRLTTDKCGVQVYKKGRWQTIVHYIGKNAKERAKKLLAARKINEEK
jgi:hypothetical protein